MISNCVIIVGARQAGVSISGTTDFLGFTHKMVSGVHSEWCENKKNKTCSDWQFCGWKGFVGKNGRQKSSGNSHNRSLQPW